jgi:hypothetical protein
VKTYPIVIADPIGSNPLFANTIMWQNAQHMP